ncbi:ImmA/IrrE family metallo-endopeptidase [Arthrobacter koreensis]|uniref:ImmA/IrrE family metallo-endopeptidase n=1 Tax=Arthrobacter koreensis TaxID=199136 RepID=UPI002DB956EF|nr:ImmA/IrrE family metallo-endopeptidase [Arthrobacter koreensis]MEB7446656.1 ImmA/IrrE family metallo-endopeptidase [Arthrobacter koreensis]
MITSLADYRLWALPRNYVKIADAMIQEILDAGAVFEDIADAPVKYVESRGDLDVIFHELRGTKGCNVQACYDPYIDPPAIFVHLSGNTGRDNFSVLHELAHHQQRVGDAWSDITEDITDRAFIKELREKVANSFASRLLLHEDLIESAFGSGPVTAAGVRWLFDNSAASMQACLYRSLELEGNRVVMQTDSDGRLFFSAANSDELFPPHKDKTQEEIARSFDRLQASEGGSLVVRGGYGIQHLSGKSYTNVVLDMALCDGCVLVIATKGRSEYFAFSDDGEYYQGSVCHDSFLIKDSPGRCTTCNEPKCSKCKACGCPDKQPPPCTRCFMLLSVNDVRAGLTAHEDC